MKTHKWKTHRQSLKLQRKPPNFQWRPVGGSQGGLCFFCLLVLRQEVSEQGSAGRTSCRKCWQHIEMGSSQGSVGFSENSWLTFTWRICNHAFSPIHPTEAIYCKNEVFQNPVDIRDIKNSTKSCNDSNFYPESRAFCTSDEWIDIGTGKHSLVETWL